MIRFDRELDLKNGVIATHFIVGMISVDKDKIEVSIDGFVSKSHADSALERMSLQSKQNILLEEFYKLSEEPEMDETKRNKLDLLQKEINDLGDKIETTVQYDSMVVCNKLYKLPYSSNLTEEYILNEILKLDDFKIKD